jgi:hypothetical protein
MQHDHYEDDLGGCCGLISKEVKDRNKWLCCAAESRWVMAGDGSGSEQKRRDEIENDQVGRKGARRWSRIWELKQWQN